VWSANMGFVKVSAPAIKRWMELSWQRNLGSRTEGGKPVEGDRQGAYNGGANYILATTRPEFQSKMTEDDKVLWKEVDTLVKKYESDPSIKSLAQQKKERETNSRR
jgi:hypothetical protein